MRPSGGVSSFSKAFLFNLTMITFSFSHQHEFPGAKIPHFYNVLL